MGMYPKNINFCLKLMLPAGVHPEKMGSKFQLFLFTALFSGQLVIIFLAILLLLYQENTVQFENITDTFSACSMILHGLLRLVTLFFKREKILDLLQRMSKNFWKPGSPHWKKNIKLEQSLAEINRTFNVFGLICASTVSTYCLETFILDGNHLAFECYQPKWMSFYQLWFFQTVVGFLSVNVIFIMDSLLMLFISFAKMQFEMLNEEILDMFNKKIVKIEDKRNHIRTIIEHHNFMLEVSFQKDTDLTGSFDDIYKRIERSSFNYIERINDTFSVSLLAYMLILISSMCVEMYNISSKGTLDVFMKAAFYILAAIFQFIVCYCLPGQGLTNEADIIAESAYFSDWIESNEASLAVQMIMANGQRKRVITAGGFVKIDLETSLSTLKTMVSYCMFLRTMVDK